MAKQKPTKMLAFLGRSRRTGRWRLASRSSVLAVLGTCHLDMTNSFVDDQDKLRMTVTVFLGSATFILPDGAEVRPSGTAILAASMVDIPEHDEESDLPTLDIGWNCVFGRVRILSEDAAAQLVAERNRKRQARAIRKGKAIPEVVSPTPEPATVSAESAVVSAEPAVAPPDSEPAVVSAEPATGPTDSEPQETPASTPESDPVVTGVGFEDLPESDPVVTGVGFGELPESDPVVTGVGFGDLPAETEPVSEPTPEPEPETEPSAEPEVEFEAEPELEPEGTVGPEPAPPSDEGSAADDDGAEHTEEGGPARRRSSDVGFVDIEYDPDSAGTPDGAGTPA